VPEPLTDEELAFLQGVLDLAREGRTEELADVVERGVPVNLTGGTGDSLLILAAYHGHPATVRMLLEHGADPDRVNDRGQTALGAAVFKQSADSVRALLDHGAGRDREGLRRRWPRHGGGSAWTWRRCCGAGWWRAAGPVTRTRRWCGGCPRTVA